MRVLVSGGSGYVGSHTVLHLIDSGHDVVVVDNFANSKRRVVDRMESLAQRRIPVHVVNLTDVDKTEHLFATEKIDAVVHFAGHKAVGESVERPLDYYSNNLGSTLSLLRAMATYDVRRLVFSSSATVYGEHAPVPYREDHEPLSAASPYGRTKVMNEQVLRDVAAATDGLKVALLRYFNPVGAHPSGELGEDPQGVPDNVMPFLAQVAVGRRPLLRVFGDDYPTSDGTCERDYIHVEDLAAGHVAALEHLGAMAEPVRAFNLGSGRGTVAGAPGTCRPTGQTRPAPPTSSAGARPAPSTTCASTPGGGSPATPTATARTDGLGSVLPMPSAAPSIVIVDDAVEVRLLIRTRLRLSGALTVVGEGADGAEAVALAAEHQPDLMLLDVSMPGMDGLAALPRVLAASPATRVVLYSGFEEHGLADRVAELGAAAFIEKSTPIDTLVDRLLGLLQDTEVPSAGGTPASRPRHVAEPAPGGDDDQAALDEHLERFRQVFDEAAIGMATITLAGTVVRANRALAALTGLPVETLVGRFYGDVTDGRGTEVTAALEKVRDHAVNVLQLEHGVTGASDGRQLQATLAPVRDSSGRPLYLFLQVQDVTEERRALEELRRSEQRFRLLVEAVEDYAIFMLSPEGIIVSWNAGAQRSKGYTAEEIIGQHFRIFYPAEVRAARHPEHELELALRKGHYEEEGWRVRKDGSTFWALVVITAVFNDEGEHLGFAKVTRDTTERRRLEQRLQRAVEDQEQFLAVTAHELRTPVGVLGGAAQTLADHWAELDDDERGELLDAMSSSTSRLRRLLTDLLTASRLQSSALEFEHVAVPVHGFLADAVSHARRTAPGVDIRLDCPQDLAVVGDKDRLAQMMDNLIENALRHGVPPVQVSVAAEGDEVTIRVRDEGSGVSDEIAPRLFDRFATGMRRGGTGLGLFIVRELARAQGGDASYEPASPHAPAGSFVLTLPRAP